MLKILQSCREYWMFVSIITLLLLSSAAYGQNRSRITGTVKDAKTGEPLIGTNVIVEGLNLGAATDIEGKYFIVNVPVGTYNLKVSMIGYKTQIIQGLIVSVDRVTQQDIELEPAVIESQEVVVTAKRDELHKEVSSTQLMVTSGEIVNSSGIRAVNTFLEKLPGVGENDNGYLTIRGGSADQTGTFVNGLSFNNASNGNAETSIPLSAIEQISLMSGGYNAEYGNFRSGLINITTKSGTKDGYHGTINISSDQSHVRRFGQSYFDPHNDFLVSYLDPSVAFQGTASAWAGDKYKQQQHPTFIGYDAEVKQRAITGSWPTAKPLDLYLLTAWMFRVVPDYAGLAKLGYTVPQDQQKLFAERAGKENFSDKNIDAGFGGPFPFISHLLGDATFYISNNTKQQYYTMPVTLDRDFSSTTLLTMKSNPSSTTTLTLNGLWKRENGVSPIIPVNGDAPDANDRGGFMPLDNLSYKSEDFVYSWDPNYYPILDQTTVMTGLTLNQMLSQKTFLELTLNYLTIKDFTPTGDNRDTTTITNFGPFYVDQMPFGKSQFSNEQYSDYSFTLPWVPSMVLGHREGDLHDNQKVYQYALKLNLTSQIDDHNYFKAGLEYNLIHLDHKFYELWNKNSYNTYEYNYNRKPSQTGLFIQDQVSYGSIVANLGVRFDYYYGGGGLWPSQPFAYDAYAPQPIGTANDSSLYEYLATGNSYIWDYWNEYNKDHPGFLQKIKNYFTVSPRLGISFPVTAESKFYFNYGQFRSNPPYYTMYQFKYRYTKNGLYQMANPNLEPPRTTSYELGVAYNFYKTYIARVSGYYKDVTGQYGTVNYQSAQPQHSTLNYKSYLNNEYQDIQGVELNISKTDDSWLTGWVNFNYMLTKKGHTGVETFSDIVINNVQSTLYQGDESRSLPQPSLNLNVTFRSPENWGPQLGGLDIFGNWDLTIFGQWRAGSYFTWNPLNDPYTNNNLRWPDYYMVDLKLSKSINIAGTVATFYVDCTNLLNLKVNMMSKGYPFESDDDQSKYLASLHLPMYDSPKFDQLRENNPGEYIAGNDKVGDLRSSSKSYINDPNYTFFLYDQPRDIWFGIKYDF
jgi:outer membrane receptor protein involved in Fe transport